MTQLLTKLIAGAWNGDFGGIQYIWWLTIATFLFSAKLEKRAHWRVRAGLGVGCMFLAALLIPPYTLGDHVFTLLWFLGSYFCNAAAVYSYCRVSLIEAFACATYGNLTEHLASATYILFLTSGFQSNAAYTVISLLVYLAVWATIGRRMSLDGHYRARGVKLIVTCVLSVMVVTVLSFLCKERAGLFSAGGIEGSAVNAMLQFSQLYDLAFCIIMLTMEYHREKQLRTQEELAASHELLRLHEEQYHLTRENIDLINRKCHDMKHQVTLLMEQGGDGEEIRQRFGREVIKTIEVYDSNIDTGNEVLNTILMDRSLYCSMHDITWTCMARGEALSFIEPMDLAALMGNALDNAVEAAEQVENKKRRIVSVQITQKERFMQLRVENSFDGELKTEGDRILTRKQDKANHGFGIASIRAIAEKYGGYASISTENHTFILSIMIPIPKDEGRKAHV